jgi:hypothetical protein
LVVAQNLMLNLTHRTRTEQDGDTHFTHTH